MRLRAEKAPESETECNPDFNFSAKKRERNLCFGFLHTRVDFLDILREKIDSSEKITLHNLQSSHDA